MEVNAAFIVLIELIDDSNNHAAASAANQRFVQPVGLIQFKPV
jgi:hypothetical protein